MAHVDPQADSCPAGPDRPAPRLPQGGAEPGSRAALYRLPGELVARCLEYAPLTALGAASGSSRRLRACALGVAAIAPWGELRLGPPWCRSPAGALEWLAVHGPQGPPVLRVVLDGCPAPGVTATAVCRAARPALPVSVVGCAGVLCPPPGPGVEYYWLPERGPKLRCTGGAAPAAWDNIQRLPSSLAVPITCVNHHGIGRGCVHAYSRCGIFAHEGMRYLRGQVGSIRQPRSALAREGWLRLFLVYYPDVGAPEGALPIGAPILVKDVGRTRWIVHSIAVLLNPVELADADALAAACEAEEGVPDKVPDFLSDPSRWDDPSLAGVYGESVVGCWHRKGISAEQQARLAASLEKGTDSVPP